MTSIMFDIVRGLNAMWAMDRSLVGEDTYPRDVLLIELSQITQLLKPEYQDDYEEAIGAYIKELDKWHGII